MVRSPKWKRDFAKKVKRDRIEHLKKPFWQRVSEDVHNLDDMLLSKRAY